MGRPRCSPPGRVRPPSPTGVAGPIPVRSSSRAASRSSVSLSEPAGAGLWVIQASMTGVSALAWVKRGRMAAPSASSAMVPIWMHSMVAKACG